MIIMLFFLFLTVVFVIGTAVYLNQKKKPVTNRPKIEQEQNTKDKKTSNKTKKQLSDILDIKINGNIICLGNRYSSVIRLGNIDYNMLSAKEQDQIETILIQTALSIDYPIQFFTTTEFIDTSKVIDEINKNKPKSYNLQEYQNYLVNYLYNLMENRTISVVRNYAVISYDGLYENAVDELTRRTLSFKNSIIRAKIQCDILEEPELYNLIYRELNKNSSLRIDNLKEGVEKLYVGKKQKKSRKKH